jgi:hypothetical protein
MVAGSNLTTVSVIGEGADTTGAKEKSNTVKNGSIITLLTGLSQTYLDFDGFIASGSYSS